MVKSQEWKPTLEDALIQEYIRERVGEDALPVAKLIEEKQPIQGVDILELLGDHKPSDIRKVLYKLEDARVAEYQKDTDKSGWETFVWRLTLNEVKYQINKERHKLIMDLENQLEIEKENSFYACANGHGRIIFEDGVALKFLCPECGQALNFVDNAERMKELDRAIRDLKELVF